MKEHTYKGRIIRFDGFTWRVCLLGSDNSFKTLGKAKDFIDRCDVRGEL